MSSAFFERPILNSSCHCPARHRAKGICQARVAAVRCAVDAGTAIRPHRGDLLNLIVEIKGYRGEDAKEKKSTMNTCWVPGVNRLGQHGRWAFAEFTDVCAMQKDFADKVAQAFNRIIEAVTAAEASVI